MSDSPLIGPVSSDRQAEVLAIVFRDHLDEDRQRRMGMLLRDDAMGAGSLAGLLEARRRGRLVGGVFSEIQAGRTAVVWPPRLVTDEPAATAERLMAAALEILQREHVRVAHVLESPDLAEDESLLRGVGFWPLADLVYLACVEEHFPLSRPTSPLEFESYSKANHDRMARVVEATYVETLDCPKLNGVRHIDDVLAGYRSTGEFAPNRWLLVAHQGEDVGCLLLADHPEQGHSELVYMGLVPTARGNGWGREITRHAQWVARRLGRGRLVLAVDEANLPAIRVYSMLGFQWWNRKRVHFRVFR